MNPTIEVEPTMFGNPIRDERLLRYQEVEVDRQFVKIMEMTAGLVCTDHIQFADIIKKYSDRRWIIEITCCCVLFLDQVEKRLDEHYKK